MENVEKRNKIWAFIILGILLSISLLYYKANVYYMYLVVYIWFGAAYGMMLQYGRFCFASASRDLFAAGVPRNDSRSLRTRSCGWVRTDGGDQR